MGTIEIFLAALAGIVVFGWLVGRITGAHAYYIEDWQYDDGETTLWRDDAADTYVITKTNMAMKMSFARLRRGVVVVTSKRIIVGTRVLFGKKRMVQQVLFIGAGDTETEHYGGGALTRGYQSIVVEPRFETKDDGKPYVELAPASGHASSANLSRIRIYTDDAAHFVMPSRADA